VACGNVSRFWAKVVGDSLELLDLLDSLLVDLDSDVLMREEDVRLGPMVRIPSEVRTLAYLVLDSLC
jgi:hypothetical protein